MTEMILASFATPFGGAPPGIPGIVLLPAAIPATWVPWLQPSTPLQYVPAPGPKSSGNPSRHKLVDLSSVFVVEKHASAMIFDAVINGWLACTPVSIIAMA